MLINLRDIVVRFSDPAVLNGVNLTIEPGERVCLAGRNGAGKSTLMKIIAGDLEPDAGERTTRDGLKLARLIQEVPHDISGTAREVIAAGLGAAGAALLEWEQAEAQGEEQRAADLQQQFEANGGWQAKVQLDAVMSRMDIDPAWSFADLSGGQKRRVLLARALVDDPDVLLLDEPTNHLDIEGVGWLESFLLSMNATLVFITHDRAFLDRIATRIVEVDRGQLNNWPGNFADFRRRKADALAAEQASNAEFDKVLAEEEEWIRRGVKARTKRNMGRVRRLEELRDVAGQRQKYHRRASLKAQMGEQSSKRVLEAKQLNVSVAGQPVLKDFDFKLQRGKVIGIMGPNGCGKTTLLRALLGDWEPDNGKLVHGENLEVAYFDQTRAQLDVERTAAWNVNEGSDKIDFDGRQIHVLGYLKSFLFTPDRANTAVKVLSGGERNRLLLAKLFTQPANFMVLDEPTNDLDIETLELLEDLVNDFPGTVLLVSHDRAFVNAVADGMLVHEGKRGFRYYVGNYDDWLRQRREEPAASKKAPPKTSKPAATASAAAPAAKAKTKLSYKLQRELEALPERIESLETEIAEMTEALSEPGFFKQDQATIRSEQQRLAALQTELETAFERWDALESGEIPES